MLKPLHAQCVQFGLTLIELVVGLAITSALLMIGVPDFLQGIQNTQVRTAAESIQNGLQLARTEAVRLNAPVRFQFTTTLDGACALATTGPHWVVSQDDPTGACDSNPSDTVPPRIIRMGNAEEGSPNAVIGSVEVTAVGGAVGGPAYTGFLTFNGLGRVGAGSLTLGNNVDINISNPVGGTCVAVGGKMRCLRIIVTSAGQVFLCDPAVAAAGDSRRCPS